MVRSKPELGRTVRMYVVYDMRRGSWGVSLQVRDHVATSFDAACVPVQGNRATSPALFRRDTYRNLLEAPEKNGSRHRYK